MGEAHSQFNVLPPLAAVTVVVQHRDGQCTLQSPPCTLAWCLSMQIACVCSATLLCVHHLSIFTPVLCSASMHSPPSYLYPCGCHYPFFSSPRARHHTLLLLPLRSSTQTSYLCPCARPHILPIFAHVLILTHFFSLPMRSSSHSCYLCRCARHHTLGHAPHTCELCT